ncbi:4-coumarate--CoA ligase-like 5 [Ischnura elegans]|uniref:4-coumarate--CoA ligase-like 5 n=1 Tax=Ischnura elegans TaxID=197161 RepID=UPI001ED88F05|nr:4-coumarate--CoA ligase-like 5 [Ischnura elegans]
MENGEDTNGVAAEGGDDGTIVKSPWASHADSIVTPDVSAADYLLGALSMNQEYFKHKPWVVDVIRKKSILFSEIEPFSYRIASALTKMGFQKGDWLYFVTYEVALIYVVHIGVWRCGGAVRGCYQNEEEEEFQRQLEETRARFVLCDRETAAKIKRVINRLSWPVTLLSVGGVVTGATSIEDMIEKDDGSAFPRDVKINPKEDVITVPNTSGSTGRPKGAMHTHHNIVSFMQNMGGPKKLQKAPETESLLTLMGNFSVGAFMHTCMAIIFGYSLISISKYNKHSFMSHVLSYKPNSIALYHYVASWLANSGELLKHDMSFLKCIICGGSIFDISTLQKISEAIPHIKIYQSYGTSETLVVTTTGSPACEGGCPSIAGLKKATIKEGENTRIHVTTGVLFPQAEGKIVDVDTGHALKRGSIGRLFLRCPFIMKGYMSHEGEKENTSVVDADGWYDTGDHGFFDESDNLYIVERSNLIFKYYMHQVSPVEIEAVIAEHPDVLSVGVVALPNPETTSLARAYVVRKPGKSVTEDEVLLHVAGKLEFYKHLHGGVKFVSYLPINSGGKLDRKELHDKAIKEMQHMVKTL